MTSGDIPDLIQKAVRLQQDNRLEEAAGYYNQVLLRDPHNADALYLLGIIALSKKDMDAAERYLREATQYHPEIAKMHAQLGSIYLEKKRYDDAIVCYQSAICAEPANPLYRYNLGCLYSGIGKHDLALEQYQQALQRGYLHSDIHLNLGLSYIELERPAEAIESLVKCLELAPQDHRALFNLATVLERQKDLRNALICYTEALQLSPENPTYQLGYIEHLDKNPQVDFNPETRQLILECVDSPYVPSGPLASILVRALKSDPVTREYFIAPGMETVRALFRQGFVPVLAENKVFKVLVSGFIIPDIDVEKFLTSIRHFLVEQLGLLNGELPLRHEDNIPLILLLIRQNYFNEYVYFIQSNERETISRLESYLSNIRSESEVNEKILYYYLVYCLYHPPYALANHELFISKLVSEVRAAQMVHEIVANFRQEQLLRTQLRTFGGISADSQAVREQYEENPYPRWQRLVLPLPNSQPVTRKTGLLNFSDPKKAWYPKSILVAGCGTGQESIRVATVYPDTDVTAIDLSLASLAYARRMSGSLGIHNIEYLHGDILHLHALGKKFDLVISSGVIHHMKQPEEGLQQLLGCLGEGGVLKLSLYSTCARRSIHALRARLCKQLPTLGEEDIRRMRHDPGLLDPDDPYIRNSILKSVDFYSLSACRDLLFHQQETTYTLGEIANLLKQYQLRLVGMDVDRQLLETFRSQYPDKEDFYSLSKWDEFESRYPDAFQAMYSFWLEQE